MVCSSMILVVSVVLVWVPVYDGRHASRTLADMHMVSAAAYWIGAAGREEPCVSCVCGVESGVGWDGIQPDPCGVNGAGKLGHRDSDCTDVSPTPGPTTASAGMVQVYCTTLQQSPLHSMSCCHLATPPPSYSTTHPTPHCIVPSASTHASPHRCSPSCRMRPQSSSH